MNVIAPDAPTGLAAEAGAGRVRVIWNAETSIPVSFYQHSFGPVGQSSSSWTTIPGSGQDTGRFLFDGLTDGVAYDFYIRAVNRTGTGTYATVRATPAVTGTDYDVNDNDLIDVRTSTQLNAIRHDPDGDGIASAADFRAAFPSPMFGMGCATTCTGYELLNDIDLSGGNWTPIDGYSAIFDGKGHVISGLTVRVARDVSAGFFGTVGATGEIRNVGFTGVDVVFEGPGSTFNYGALAGVNRGKIAASYVVGGIVRGGYIVGGLVGENNGTVIASYADVSVHARNLEVGGLLGRNFGELHASYSIGMVGASNNAGDDPPFNVGGLVGRAGLNEPSLRIVATMTSSYFDRERSGQSACCEGPDSPDPDGTPQTTVGLQSPTVAGGIYAGWDGLDVDGVGGNDDSPWYFGSQFHYPVLWQGATEARAGNVLAQLRLQRSLQVRLGGPETVPEDAGAVTYSVRPTAALGPGVTARVQWVVSGAGTRPAAADDFGGATSGVVAIADATTSMFTVTINDDDDAELAEMFEVRLSATVTDVMGVVIDLPLSSTAIMTTIGTNDFSPPPPPASLAVASTAPGRVTVSWEQSTDASVSQVTRYESGFGAAGASSASISYSVIEGSSSLTTSHVFTGLTGGVAYDFYIRAVNIGGEGTPAVVSETATAANYNADGDNLIDVASVAQLAAIRHDLDGVGNPSAPEWLDAFSGAPQGVGCATTCTGYELLNDIDLSGVAFWQPIGGGVARFMLEDSGGYTGVFEGNGYVISNLNIAPGSGLSNVGLFGLLSRRGIIRNVGVRDANVDLPTGSILAGGLVGLNYGTIAASYVIGGSVQTGAGAGGLAGSNQGTVVASYADVAVRAKDGGGSSGGLLAHMAASGVVSASYSVGAVTGVGGSVLGGLIGDLASGGEIIGSYFDRDRSGQTTCCGTNAPTTDVSVKTSHELRVPTTAAGIYAGWDRLDVDGAGGNDDSPWYFGSQFHYPVLWQGATEARAGNVLAQLRLQRPLQVRLVGPETVPEDAGAVTYSVRPTAALGPGVTARVQWVVSGAGTRPAAADDFEGATSGVVAIADATTGTFTVTINDDDDAELAEMFEVRLSATVTDVMGVVIDLPLSSMAIMTTIGANDFRQVTVSARPSVVEEGGVATFTVALSGAVDEAPELTYVIRALSTSLTAADLEQITEADGDGSSTREVDSLPAMGAVTLDSSGMATIAVRVMSDDEVEGTERFRLELGCPGCGSLYPVEIGAEGAATVSIPGVSLPPPPASLAVVSTASVRVTVSWEQSTDASAGRVTGYESGFGPVGASSASISYSVIEGSSSLTTSHVFTGLTGGVPYDFYIRAVNVAGRGMPAMVSATAMIVPLPPPPASLAVVSTASGRVSVSWEQSTDASVGRVIEYQSGFGPAGASSASISYSVIAGSSSLTTSHVFTGLTGGVAYDFYIRAVNVAGGGMPAMVSETAVSAPPPPASLAATSTAPGRVTVSWEQSTDASVGRVTEYRYGFGRAGTRAAFIQYRVIAGSSSLTTSHVFTRLTGGVAYDFYIRAVNFVGRGMPAVVPATATAANYDADGDDLIDVESAAQLSAIRHDLSGGGNPSANNEWLDAFPGAPQGMGCPGTCAGYELSNDIDLSGVAFWQPIGGGVADFMNRDIGGYTGVFGGNGYVISNLNIVDTNLRLSNVGLFGLLSERGIIRNVGVRNVEVDLSSDSIFAGGLAGRNYGTIAASYVIGGRVRTGLGAGGLAGSNEGTVVASYADVDAHAKSNSGSSGGLLGILGASGVVSASYSIGAVTGVDGSVSGGLIGELELASGGEIISSYFDLERSGQTACCGRNAPTTDVSVKTSHELRVPTTAAGIYAGWDRLNVDGVDRGDDSPWDFGGAFDYPVLVFGGSTDTRQARRTAQQQAQPGVRLTPTLSGDAMVSEGATASYVVSLPRTLPAGVTASWSWAVGGTGIDDVDVATTVGSVVIAPGRSSASFSLMVRVDGVAELAEVMEVSLSDARLTGVRDGVSLGVPAAAAQTTIAANELRQVTVSAQPTQVEEGGITTFTLALSGGVDQAVVVEYEIAAASEDLTPGDLESVAKVERGGTTSTQVNTLPVAGSVTLRTDGTAEVSVRVTSDTVSDEGRELFRLRLTGCANCDTEYAVEIGSPSSAAVAILIDYSSDGSLIDVRTAGQLHAVRWDLDGDGVPAQASSASYLAAFPDAASNMGCTSTCTGYALRNGIDLGVSRWSSSSSTAGWPPIGAADVPYAARFDGAGRVIRNLFINRSGQDYAGLFGGLGESGRIERLGLINAVVVSATYVGALVGSNKGQIIESHASVIVTDVRVAGGLVGINDGGEIRASYATGAVDGNDGIGGLAGVNDDGEIIASYVSGTVSGNDGVGGLAGRNDGGEIRASYAIGAVSGNDGIGGLAGINDNGEIRASYAVATVSGTGDVGGLAGRSSGSITYSYWDTDFSGLGSSAGGTGKTSSELRTPTTYTGIYSAWDVDVDGDDTADAPWDFGTVFDYPVLVFGGEADTRQARRTVQQQAQPGVRLTPTLSGDAMVSEGAMASYVVSLPRTLPLGISASWSWAVGGTGIDDRDVAATSGVVVIAPGRSSASFSLMVLVDGVAELAEVMVVSMSDARLTGVRDGVSLGVPAAATRTAIAANEFGLITVSAQPTQVGEGGVTTFTVALSDAVDQAVVVEYEITAVSEDLTPGDLESVTEVERAGTTSTQVNTLPLAGSVTLGADGTAQVSVQVESDAVSDEGRERFRLRLTGCVNCGTEYAASIGSPSSATVAILINYSSDGSLIDVRTAGQLHAMRWDLDGDGAPAQASSASYFAAFPDAAPNMGCTSTCTGYALRNDIDLGVSRWSSSSSTAGWPPIGAADVPYAARFDGAGNVIRNLFINRSGQDYAGLFGGLGESGRIERLGLIDAVVASATYVGALVGSNKGEIIESRASGIVTDVRAAGGLVGINDGGEIRASYAVAAVSGNDDVGGLAGINDGGEIRASYASATVSGNNAVGGLAGRNDGGEIRASYAIGAVSGNDGVGGLAGINDNGEIRASYAVATVSGTGDVGGLAGRSSGSITYSYWDTDFSGLGSSAGGTGKTSSELRTPTTYTGIYSAWDVDVDGDDTADAPWDFGTVFDYPVLVFGGEADTRQARRTVQQQAQPGVRLTPTLSGDATVSEGAIASYVVSLPVALPAGISASWSWTVGGVGIDDVDVATTVGSVVIAPGRSSASFSLMVLVDGVAELAEVMEVSMSNARLTGAPDDVSLGVPAAAAQTTIEANELRLITVSAQPTQVEEGGITTFTVALAGGVDQAVVVEYEITTASEGLTPGDLERVAKVERGGTTSTQVNTLPLAGSVTLRTDGTAEVSVRVASDAVSDEERERFRLRLTGCANCGTEYAAEIGSPSSAEVAIRSERTDIDYSSDGSLIDVRTAGQLHAMRWDLDGDGVPAQASSASYFAAFPNAASNMGCTSTCTGYALRNDIDLGVSRWSRSSSTAGWAPIGAADVPYAARFDGAGNVIRNLFINRSSQSYVGLFGELGASGRIERLGLIDAVVVSATYVGALVGSNKGQIIESHASVIVTDVRVAGGLVGINDGGEIRASYAIGAVDGNDGIGDGIGGLAGVNDDGEIIASYVSGTVSGNDGVGGLVGWNNGGEIRTSYAVGAVSGNDDAGGLVGWNDGGEIRTSYAVGAVSGNDDVGGLAGRNDNNGQIRASYAIGAVSGYDDVGGLVGRNNGGEIIASYAIGAVRGNDDVGGLAGRNHNNEQIRGRIIASYAVATVSGRYDVGGLVGRSSGSITSYSYWDTDVSGLGSSAGGVGKTTSELRTPTSYTGIYSEWDVDVDGDDTADAPWDFGTVFDYPVLVFGGEADTRQARRTSQQRAQPEVGLTPTLSGDATVSEGDTASYMVSLPVALPTGVSASWSWTVGGTGIDATDVAATSGVVVIAPGRSSASFSLMVRVDVVAEPAEVMEVSLSAPRLSGARDGVSLGVPAASAQTTIEANRLRQVTVSAQPTQVEEGGITTFTVALSGGVDQAVVVEYEIAAVSEGLTPGDLESVTEVERDGTSSAQVNTLPLAGSVTLRDGIAQVSVRVTSDTVSDEGRERFHLRLTGCANCGSPYAAAIGSPSSAEVVIRGERGITVDARVYLQGAYDRDELNMLTRLADILPRRQPYWVAPWNYPATTTVMHVPNDRPGLSGVTSTIVDWVLVELRSGANAAVAAAARPTTGGRAAGLLLSDGRIVGINEAATTTAEALSLEGIRFEADLPQGEDVYVLIHHRNHLSVMSAQPATNTSAGVICSTDPDYCVDFRDKQSYIGCGQVSLSDSDELYGMYAGDVGRTGLITRADLAFIGDNDSERPTYARMIEGNYLVDGDLDFSGLIARGDETEVGNNDSESSACSYRIVGGN